MLKKEFCWQGKSFLFVLLLLLIVVSIGMADADVEMDGDVDPAVDEEILSLEEAIMIALENSPEIILAEFDIREAELDLKQARSREGIDISQEELTAAEERFQNAKENFELAKMALALNVKERYYNLIKARENVEFSKENVLNAKQQEERNQKRLEAGLLTSMEMFLEGLDNLVENAELQLQQHKISVETAEMNLNMVMGLPLDASIKKLIIDTEYEITEYDLDDSLEIAMENSNNIINAERALVKAIQDLDLLVPEYTAKASLERAEMAVTRAEINLEKAENSILFAVRQVYFGYENAIRNIDNSKLSLLKAERNLEIQERRYQADLISLSAIQSSRNNLIHAENDVRKAIYDFHIAEANLLRTLGLPYGPLTRISER